MKPYRSTYLLALLIAGLLSPLAPAYADPAADREFQARLTQAMQGDADAQYRVGEMYEQGIGTGRDAAMAYLWFNKAANSGNARARDKLAAAEKADVNEQSRVNSAMRALQQQSVDQDTAAKQKAAVDARRVQQDEAARLAREKAASAAATQAAAQAAAEAAAKARAEAAAKAAAAAKPAPKAVEPPKLIPVAVTPPPVPAKPAVAPTAAKSAASKTSEAGQDEFKANPCKGPQAKFLSTCN